MAKKTFTLTAADIGLLNTVHGMYESVFLNPAAPLEQKERMNTLWRVLGEKHGFDGTTAEPHPEGEPKILAAQLEEKVLPTHHPDKAYEFPIGSIDLRKKPEPTQCLYCSHPITTREVKCELCGVYQIDEFKEPIRDMYVGERILSEAADAVRKMMYFRNEDGELMGVDPALFNKDAQMTVFGLATEGLQVLKSAAGYYIGTLQEDAEDGIWYPYTRQSQDYWATYEQAAECLRTGKYTPKF